MKCETCQTTESSKWYQNGTQCRKCFNREYNKRRQADPVFRAKKQAMVKAWRQENPEKKKENDRRWAEAHKEEEKIRKHEHYVNNKDQILHKQREYQLAHREEILAYKRDYYAQHKKRFSDYGKQYYLMFREQIKARNQIYRLAHPEQTKEMYRRYYIKMRDKYITKAKAWDLAHPEKRKQISREYGSRNQPAHNARTAFRRAKQLQATPPWLTSEHKQQIKELYQNCPQGYHVDHIVPLNNPDVSGLHVPWNLQIIPAEDNLRKSNRF